MASSSPRDFMDTLARCLAPELPLYLVQAENGLALYAGLWSTWLVGEDGRAAKVVFVTVLTDPAQAPPPGPVTLAELQPWLVFQLQHLTTESPAWDSVAGVLRPSLEAAAAAEDGPAAAAAGGVTFDPVQKNHASRAVAEPSPLVALRLQQWEPAAPRDAALPRPLPALDRQLVEYRLPAVAGIRAFLARASSKSPLQRDMNRNCGLARTGNVLGAVNEWHTWFVADHLD